MSRQTNKVFLIDAYGLCYRAYYAVKGLVNSKGQATNAVFGFCNILRKLLNDLKPTHIAACFDVGKKTHRHEKFSAYKKQRQAMPDDLISQIKIIRDVLKAYRIPILEMEGYEADDVMASLAARYASSGTDIIIVTEDKDMGQIIKDHVQLYSARQEKFIGPAQIKEKFGITPEQVVDYIALAGDASDNIPGVEGIGEVGARKLLESFRDLEGIYEHLDDVKGDKLKEKLRLGKEDAFLSRELATLHPQVKLTVSLDDLVLKEPDAKELLSLFQELEFKKFAQELSAVTPQEHEVIVDFKRHMLLHEHGKAIDVVYDLKSLLKAKQAVKGDIFDVHLAGYLLTGSQDKADINVLAWQYLKQKPSEYVLKDLYAPMHAALIKDGLEPLYRDIELPLVAVLVKMEQEGVALDQDALANLSRICQDKMSFLEKDLYASAGSVFNVNSPKQLGEILFERLKLPVIKKTKTGSSTDEEVLTRLAEQHPLPAMILEYRQLAKLKSTYIDALPELIDPVTKRIHAHFNQTGAETGRLSSNNPNLQNIPIRTELGRQIRSAFIPLRPGDFLLSADYSQIELRILAHLSNDQGLKEAFAKNQDIHRYTASLMFDVKEEAVDEKMRYAAKRINFGIIYGMSSFGLAKDLGVSLREAQEFIDKYFLRYPRVQGYLNDQIQKAKELGYVTTMFNRRRYLPQINDRNIGLRQFAQRQAINAPIQGTAADLIKKAMVDIDACLIKENLASAMIMTVHDELVFNVCVKERQQMIDLVRFQMENVIKLSVPVSVSVKVGKNWLDMDKV